MDVVRTRQSLKAYPTPDTSGSYLYKLKSGVYRLLEQQTVGNSDFVRVASKVSDPTGVWICSRWNTTTYADVETRLDSVPEATLLSLLDSFVGFRYTSEAPGKPPAVYPLPLPNVDVTVKKSGDRFNNCCTFVEGLLVPAWEKAHSADFAWSWSKHKQMMITDDTKKLSPLTALVDSHMAFDADPRRLPAPWSVAQGWRKYRKNDGSEGLQGHTFLVVDVDEPTGKVLTLESTTAGGLDGPGWRYVAPLAKGSSPPAEWWKHSVRTWSKVRSHYNLKLGVVSLSVTDRKRFGGRVKNP